MYRLYVFHFAELILKTMKHRVCFEEAHYFRVSTTHLEVKASSLGMKSAMYTMFVPIAYPIYFLRFQALLACLLAC